jgi:hypothetical protein
VQILPHFLKGCEELTRQLSATIAKDTNVFVTCDVIRLYPNINIVKCVTFFCQFLQERITAEDPTVDMDEISLAHFHDLMEVILNESYRRFANKVFKAVQGFPTGLACGRTCDEIYLHMLERDLWTRFRCHMSFARRYIDDFQGIFDSEEASPGFHRRIRKIGRFCSNHRGR